MQVPVWDARFPARDAFGRFVSQSQRTQWPNVAFQEAQSVRFSPNEMGWFAEKAAQEQAAVAANDDALGELFLGRLK